MGRPGTRATARRFRIAYWILLETMESAVQSIPPELAQRPIEFRVGLEDTHVDLCEHEVEKHAKVVVHREEIEIRHPFASSLGLRRDQSSKSRSNARGSLHNDYIESTERTSSPAKDGRNDHFAELVRGVLLRRGGAPPLERCTMKARILKLALVGCAGSLVVAIGCSASDGTSTGSTASALSDGRTDVCHVTEDGSILRLTVDEHALPAHLGHGDHVPFDVFPDADGDGYGDASATATGVCEAAAGQVTNNSDCADGNAAIHPGAEEICANKIDDNCDGKIDEACFDVWPDKDGDGYGDAKATATSVHVAGPGQVMNNGDCDDANAKAHPGAPEVCGNGIDDDCNGKIDDGCPVVCTTPTLPTSTCGCYCGFMSKAWCDVFGWKWDATNGVCITPYPSTADCDYIQKKHRGDGSGSDIYNLGLTCSVGPAPKACDPKVDKGCFFVWPDADFDGYGDAKATPTGVFAAGPGQVTNNSDCNDFNWAVHPGALEVCGNGIDDNCDGAIDEGCKPPPTCSSTPTIPLDTCGCYCGFMSEKNCAAFGWIWDAVNSVCYAKTTGTKDDCATLQAKHSGDGSGSDIYNLGVTCTLGTGK